MPWRTTPCSHDLKPAGANENTATVITSFRQLKSMRVRTLAKAQTVWRVPSIPIITISSDR